MRLLLIFVFLFSIFGCYAEEEHCHIVIKEAKNQNGVTIDTYVFWSDCPEYQTN